MRGNLDAQPHPWNTGFAWPDHDGPLWALRAADRDRFDRDGFVVLPDLVPTDLRRDLEAELDRCESEVARRLRPAERDREAGRDRRAGPDGGESGARRVTISEAGAITFSEHLVVRSPLLKEFAAHPILVALAHDLVGPSVRLYWDQAVYKKPEKPRRFPWHQDNGYTFVEPQHYLTCWIAINDATVDNGCPWVVPGIHRHGTLAHRFVDPLGYECFADHPDKLAVPVRAGGAVVFSSLTPHLTGPNTSGTVRKAYILQYAPNGAHALLGDPAVGEPTGRARCDAPDRQFPVLTDNRAVPPPVP